MREAQAGTVERLVDSWPAMFGDSNPNGVVVAHNQSGATNSAVVELMEPKLNGSTMTYTVRVLTNEGGPAEPGVAYNFGQWGAFPVVFTSIASWALLSVFAWFWMNRFNQGPLERVLALITGKKQPA